MPEGHTIHRIARDHGKWFAGQCVDASSPQGRFAAGAEHVSGRRLDGVDAWGKHLFYHFHGGAIVHVHLGLFGRFRVHRRMPAPPPRDTVRWRIVGATRSADLIGPTVCELAAPESLASLMARLGPDPLRDDADPVKAWERIRSSKAPIGALLLNQSVIAGVGNVYRAEILHALAIHPDRLGRDVERAEFDALWALMVRWLALGVRYNRIVTPEPGASGRPGRHERLRVYRQPQCPRCGADVYCWELANRTIYACDVCQH